MGRTNGKLVNYLKSGLMNSTFINLQYDSEDFQTFIIDLPRFERNRDMREHEKILKEWYRCNGKLHHYKSYSNAKAVFQAALKKSIYLVSLERVASRLKFKFATKEEAEAKRLLLSERCRQDPVVEILSVPPSPSSSEASSGYHSGSEGSPVPDDTADENFLDDVLADPFKYIENGVDLDTNLFDDLLMDQTESPEFENNNFDDLAKPLTDQVVQEPQPLIDDVAYKLPPVCESLPKPVPVQNETKSVMELNPIPVAISNVAKKFFWRCTQKFIVDNAILVLICDKEIVEDANNTINEGHVFIPNEVWQPGICYKPLKSDEVGDKNFVYFSQESV